MPKVWGRRVHAVFFGGGTPSLFSPAAIDRLLTAARTLLPVEPDAEVTLEANPGTFEQAKFRDFRGAGVNRLSVGIQSFDARLLKAIGRVHDAAEARRAAEIAMATFANVNLDLMYALPGQSREEALADIGAAIGFGPAHVSAYHLTLEPNTLFHRYPPELPDDDAAAAMQEAIEEALAAAGLRELRDLGLREARHALAPQPQLLALRRLPRRGRGRALQALVPRARRARGAPAAAEGLPGAARSPGDAIQEAHEVAAGELPFEFMMNALRLAEGFPVALFAERTGLAARQRRGAARPGRGRRPPRARRLRRSAPPCAGGAS